MRRSLKVLEGDRHILRTVISTAIFEDSNPAVLYKPSFMFGDVTPDLNQQLLAGLNKQLLAGEDQWIFKIREDKYYLPSIKHHFPLLSSSQ